MLLTYRAAAARGLTVEEWEERTPQHEKPYWLAMVWMDAHGEEWAEVVGMIFNTTRGDGKDCLPSNDHLRLKQFRKKPEPTDNEWQAAAKRFENWATGARKK